MYRCTRPSVLTQEFQVFVAAMRRSHMLGGDEKEGKYVGIVGFITCRG